MGLGPQVQTNGNIQSSWILLVTITPAATGATTTLEQTFTVAGLQIGDIISITPQFAITTLVTLENARVSANNTLALAFNNSTAGGLTYPSGVFAIEVNRPYPGLAMSSIQ